MSRSCALMLALVLLSNSAPTGEPARTKDKSADAPKLLFHLSFDEGSLTATGAGGPVNPLAAPKAPTFEDGRRGKALCLSPARDWRIVYPTKGRLDLDAGTISWWVKYPRDFPERPRGDLFQTGDAKTHNAITVRFHWARRRKAGFWFVTYFHAKRLRPVRFTIMDWYGRSVGKWKPGEWHHVMIVWDTLRGVALYYDGKSVAGPPTNNGPFVFLEASPEMVFGPANLSVDEFRIYDRPLTPADLARMTGLPRADNLPKEMKVKYHYVR